MAGSFSNDFSDDFDNEDSEYQIRVRPVGSTDETVRQGFNYSWTLYKDTVDEEIVSACSMPRNIDEQDVDITEMDLAEATGLADRLHADSEAIHQSDFEKEVI